MIADIASQYRPPRPAISDLGTIERPLALACAGGEGRVEAEREWGGAGRRIGWRSDPPTVILVRRIQVDMEYRAHRN